MSRVINIYIINDFFMYFFMTKSWIYNVILAIFGHFRTGQKITFRR